MLDITKLSQLSGDEYSAVVALHPLKPGRGHTIGNALRRALLNDLPGAAVTAVRVKGAPHQFMSLKGMKEDMVEFLLNVKLIRLIHHGDSDATLKLNFKGPGKVSAGDIAQHAEIEVVNKDLVLGNLADEKSSIEAELKVVKGVGYETVEDRNALDPQAKPDLGEIQLDALYSPVARVNYRVENARVGRVTNFDKIVLEIETDGTVTVLKAIQDAAKLLTEDFGALSGFEYSQEEEEVGENEDDNTGGEVVVMLDDLDLPPKILNRLKEHGFNSVQELVDAGREELLKIPNFGEKSLEELEEKIKSKGIEI
jgi:DNA-directed RNA polymerase subunit alpha